MSHSPGLYASIVKKARDILYRGYAQQLPVHFQYHCVDVNGGLSFRIDDNIPGFGAVFRAVVPYTSKAELQYIHDYIGITAGIGLTTNSSNPSRGFNLILSFSGAIGGTVYTLGTDIAFDLSARAFSRIRTGLGFNMPYLVASLTLNDELDTLRATFFGTLNQLNNTAMAAEVTHSYATDLLNNSTDELTCSIILTISNSYARPKIHQSKLVQK